jgi:hypothetical protein
MAIVSSLQLLYVSNMDVYTLLLALLVLPCTNAENNDTVEFLLDWISAHHLDSTVIFKEADSGRLLLTYPTSRNPLSVRACVRVQIIHGRGG